MADVEISTVRDLLTTLNDLVEAGRISIEAPVYLDTGGRGVKVELDLLVCSYRQLVLTGPLGTAGPSGPVGLLRDPDPRPGPGGIAAHARHARPQLHVVGHEYTG